MTRRYAQMCGLAVALDLVGDRWTLLVVRELLVAPRRYRDLLAGIPGVPTDMLALRLRQLESAGLVRQTGGNGDDARAKVYELTDDGHGLEESVLALSRFGLRHLDTASTGSFRAHWLELAVRAMLHPERLDAELVVAFDCHGDVLRLRLSPSGVLSDPEAAPDVTVDGSPAALLEAVSKPQGVKALVRSGVLKLHGTKHDIARFAQAIGPA